MISSVTSKPALPVLVASTTVAFVGGLGVATFWLRLRDRHRLRQATSRIKKSLRSILPQQKLLMNPLQSNSKREKVVVIGAGSYGTAMAYTAAVNMHEVVLFMRDPKQCQCINENQYNPKYLSQYPLNPNSNAIRAICTRESLEQELNIPGVIVILALPCQLTPDWIRQHKDIIPSNILLCSTSKGLYLKTKQLIGHAILDALDRVDQPLAFLSGPGFAQEIVQGNPTSVVVASDPLYYAVRIQKLLSNPKSFRVYTSQDPIGVQLAGALKNPLAVGAGMIAGMGFGINTLSAAVTRASRELCDLCIAMGGNPATIDGLAGIGDLMLTCFSNQSRNQRCGQRLIQGESIQDIQKEFTVEGVATAEVAMAYAELCGLELPLFSVVYNLIHGNIAPEKAVEALMGRSLKQETYRPNMAHNTSS